MLRRTLLDVADEADEAVHMMIVTDARRHILWREGHAEVLRRADDAALVEGPARPDGRARRAPADRNQVHLDGLRGEPGALLTPRGRVLAASPGGSWPERVTIPERGDRVDLGERGEGVLEPLAEGCCARRGGRRRRRSPCPSWAPTVPWRASTAARCA